MAADDNDKIHGIQRRMTADRRTFPCAWLVVAAVGMAQGCACDDPHAASRELRAEDESVRTRRRAIECLAESPRFSHDFQPALAYALGDSDPEVRRRAAAVLMNMARLRQLSLPKPAADEAFLRALKTEDETAHIMAITILGPAATPGTVMPALSAVLAARNGHSGARRAAAEILCLIGDASAVRDLEGLLGVWDTPLQIAALKRLASLGSDAVDAAPAIEKVLLDGTGELREAAAEALAAICRNDIGSIGRAAADALGESLDRGGTAPAVFRTQTADARVRALADFGALAVPTITRALQDDRPIVRIRAMRALAGFAEWRDRGGKWKDGRRQGEVAQLYAEAVPAVRRVIAMLDDPEPDVRGAAHHALTHMGPFVVAIPAVRAALSAAAASRNVSVRDTAKRVLATTPPTFWTASLLPVSPEDRPLEGRWSFPEALASPSFVTMPPEVASGLQDPGHVTLKATITPQGAITSIRAVPAGGSPLARACMEALRGWKYRGGTRLGKPAAFELTYSCRSSIF
jgi:HEAT repeat protein